MIGASGAIAGVLGAYLVLFPAHKVVTFFFFIFVHVPAGAYLALWLFLQFAYQEPGVTWEAHVGGFIAGALITLPLRFVLLNRVRRLHEPVPQHRMIWMNCWPRSGRSPVSSWPIPEPLRPLGGNAPGAVFRRGLLSYLAHLSSPGVVCHSSRVTNS